MSNAKYYIDKFNNLHGKKVYKKDIVDMLQKVKAENCPELKEVEKKLKKIASKLNGKPRELFIKDPVILKVKKNLTKAPNKEKEVRTPARSLTREKGMNLASVESTDSKILKYSTTPKVVKKSKTFLNGVVDASAIGNLNFTRIDLDGKYKDDFVRMYDDTQFMFWGRPGHGKTVALLKFAQYLANKNLKVLYMADEEMNRSTLTEKINEFKIGHPNLKITKDFDSLKKSGINIQYYDAVFFDSIQSLGFTIDTYKKFVKENPGRIYVLIVQSTKEGGFKGGQEWLHEVDIAGEFVNYRLILYKNRYDNKFAEKSNKLLLDERVNEGTKKMQIREEIKNKLKPKVDVLNGNIIMS